jgi:hypothetical protein
MRRNLLSVLLMVLVVSAALPFTFADGSLGLGAVSPQYHKRGDLVNYNGWTTPSASGIEVGILVRDYLSSDIFTDQVTTVESPIGTFTGSFILNLGSEGRDTIYASATGFTNASATFYADFTPPTSTVTSPANNTTVYSAPSTITGDFNDPLLADGNTGSGVSSVTLTLQRASDNAYWTGSTWGSETWLPTNLNQPNTGNWTIQNPSAITPWDPTIYHIIQNTTDTAGNSRISGVTSFTYTSYSSTVLTALPAYQGARLSWTTVSGADSYDVFYHVPSWNQQSFGNVPSSTLSLDATIPPGPFAWDQIVTWTVRPMIGGNPRDDLAGSADALASSFKINVTSTEVLVETTSEIKVRLNYASINFTAISTGTQIGEIVSATTPPTPIAILMSSPILLTEYGTTGYYLIDYTPSGGITPGNYEVWFFLWNQLPNEGGSWETYTVKVVATVTVS